MNLTKLIIVNRYILLFTKVEKFNIIMPILVEQYIGK